MARDMLERRAVRGGPRLALPSHLRTRPTGRRPRCRCRASGLRACHGRRRSVVAGACLGPASSRCRHLRRAGGLLADPTPDCWHRSAPRGRSALPPSASSRPRELARATARPGGRTTGRAPRATPGHGGAPRRGARFQLLLLMLVRLGLFVAVDVGVPRRGWCSRPRRAAPAAMPTPQKNHRRAAPTGAQYGGGRAGRQDDGARHHRP